jgi:cobalt-zinc-cadmium efflux system protein
MSAGHDHGGHSHNHAAGANSRMLAIALALTTAFLIAEVIGAFVFNSLALLSDAAHMFTDAAALAIALAAVKIGQRPADDMRTFGYRRFEILAAAFNALLRDIDPPGAGPLIRTDSGLSPLRRPLRLRRVPRPRSLP